MVSHFPSAGPEHERFTDWAVSQGIVINDITPVRFRGQGLGIAAQRKIAAGEILVSVPISALFTVDHIPASFKAKFKEDGQISVQGLYAAYFAWDRTKDENNHSDGEDDIQNYTPWQAVWPKMQEFKESMPILWPHYLTGQKDRLPSPDDSPVTTTTRSFLPPSISGSWISIPTASHHPPTRGYHPDHQVQLPEQIERLETAWEIAKRALPDLDREKYIYHWLVVNTRSFYYVPKGCERPEDRNDAMAMCPFADYFNHSDDDNACEAIFDDRRYVFRTRRSYEAGEEIFASYGNHSNDVLLTEYGFLLQRNQSDCVYLDDLILNDINEEQKEDLKLERYLGDYELTSQGPCYRSFVAACRTYMSSEDWHQYILGEEPASFNEAKTNKIVAGWISGYIKEANLAISELKTMQIAEKDRRHVTAISVRWQQMIKLCNDAMQEVV